MRKLDTVKRMFINHSSKEVTAKIVYYGPGLSGKTTNLQYIFSVTNPKTRGELVSIETDVERTLFFDLLPINVGLVNGYQTKFQLYTVPGQVFYDSTRKLVLKGADGLVFVADSQEIMESANLESLENLRQNLSLHNQNLNDIPMVFQFNKRDLKNTSSIDYLNKILNKSHRPSFSATATKGTGVIETLREISSMTLKKIKELMDQSTENEDQKTYVNFDMEKKHKISKKTKSPFKKDPPEPPEELDLNNKMIPEVEEKQIFDENDNVLELNGFEEIEEIEELKGFEEIPETEGLMELNEADKVEEPISIEEAGKAKEVKEKQQAPEPNKKEAPKLKLDAIDLLNKFKDASRLTIIKKMKKFPGKDSPIFIEVKDKDSNLLEPIEVKVTPDIKKITIILDVKK